MEGGFFLVQRVDLGQGADRGSGVSRLSSTNGRSGPSEEIGSRFYGNTNDTMDYG
jgi:hypothetical protein